MAPSLLPAPVPSVRGHVVTLADFRRALVEAGLPRDIAADRETFLRLAELVQDSYRDMEGVFLLVLSCRVRCAL